MTTGILRHRKLASVLPPIVPAQRGQAVFAFDEAAAGVGAAASCHLKNTVEMMTEPDAYKGN